MMNKNNVSKATLRRYPIYLKALRKIKEKNITKIMSKQLAEYVAIQPTTIRRDFSMIGSMGKQGQGYDVDFLISKFEEVLGVINENDERPKIILVGVGNIGRILLEYNSWINSVGKLTYVFDNDAKNIKDAREVISGPIFSIGSIKQQTPKDCKLAIINTSTDVQKIVDELFEMGIRGILDLTREHFIVPPGMSVRTVDIVSEIQELVFECASH